MRSNEARQVNPDNGTIFVMVGTIHRDAEGPDALARWLEVIDPDVITLEFSNYGLHFRQINGHRLRDRLCRNITDMGLKGEDIRQGAMERLFSYICLPYEFISVSDFADKTGTPFHLVDADSFSRLKLKEIDSMIGRENLENLLDDRTAEPIGDRSRERVLAELFFNRAIQTCRYTEEMRIRDDYMKHRISLVMQHHGPGRYAHVCGWQHLPDPCEVYAPLSPTKVFVHDRTFCI
jgi:hypothetical protein